MYSFKIILVVITLIVSSIAYPQSYNSIPLLRKMAHDDIDRTQQALLKSARPEDSIYTSTGKKELNPYFTDGLIGKVNDIQNSIETDTLIDDGKKINFLKGLKEVLNAFENARKVRELTPDQLPILIQAYRTAMNLETKDLSLLPVVQENEFAIGHIIIQLLPFQNARDLDKSKEILVLKAYQKNPAGILPVLYDIPDVSFADSLIKITARFQPEKLYTYAQARNTPLGVIIHKCTDHLVKIIASLAEMDNGQLYLPFLGNLVAGKITMAEISKTLGGKNKIDYYKLLVRTQIGYANRLQKKDTPVAVNSLLETLKRKAIGDYINVINELHEQPDFIRLKVLTGLNSQDLYYLCITGENELYTSSYLKIYNLILRKMKPLDSYIFLQTLHFDHFRRFIKMAANFNKLTDFLNRMQKENADSLMRSFVNGMETQNNLEDAVDVADSYASLPGVRLRNLILTEVQKNITRLPPGENKVGATIYGLLNTLFLSMEPKKNIDVSSALGIPPVYQLNNKLLQDEEGKIIIQQFFYGDKDGQYEFRNFIRAFNNPKWKITWMKDWVMVQSVKGTNIVVYSNRPLDEETFLDTRAQNVLGKYLEANNLRPSIVIHRGHSYYVQSTIRQLAPSAKLVLLGSCGGYNNLSRVIEKCPYVHIIATKQLGSGSINQPLIFHLTELLREGKDLYWPGIWKILEKKFSTNKRFEDYIPPHQNLGAIFIMAYTRSIASIN